MLRPRHAKRHVRVLVTLAAGALVLWVLGARSARAQEDAGHETVGDETSSVDGGSTADAAEAAAPLPSDAGIVDDAGTLEIATSDGGLGLAGGSEGAAGDGEPAAPPPVAETPAAAETTGDVVRTLLGLVALLALAWAGGHERMRKLEERLGIAQVMTSGLPFVLLGVVARAPGIDVLNESVLQGLTPLLQFGLGWIGFHTGYQLDSRAAAIVPRGTATVVILLTALPFLLITALAGAALWGLGLSTDHVTLTRDAVMLGLAGALSAPTLQHLARASSPRAIELVQTMSLLDDVVVIVAFSCLAAWLRPAGGETGWVLPAVGWVFVTFGMAAVLGLVTQAVVSGTDSAAERTSLLLGTVCLTAGMASTFQLPPLVVCFLAGVLLRNLPGGDKRQLEESFSRLERPIYHLFLIIVGALWRPESSSGWIVLPLFLAARTLGRFVGARVARALPEDGRPASLSETPDADLVLPPMGQLAIAFVITAQTLYESAAIRALVTAVLGGSIVMELVVQLGARRRTPASPAPPSDPGAAS